LKSRSWKRSRICAGKSGLIWESPSSASETAGSMSVIADQVGKFAIRDALSGMRYQG
jgi:hypothetical protein